MDMLKKLFVFFWCTTLPWAILAQTDTVRVTCVGNSITNGGGEYTYPFQLGNMLGPGYSVLNCGSAGKTMLRHGNDP